MEVYPKTGDQKQVWLAVIHDKTLWTNEQTGKYKIITRLLIGQIAEQQTVLANGIACYNG